MEPLKRPYITEKSMTQAARGFYTFVVDTKANKAQIADAINKQYNVTVTHVLTSTFAGKMRRVGKKMLSITKPDWKKAVVVLKPGQKIDAFEVAQNEGKK